MKLADAARKSIVACVSDFASKGIKPQYGIISVNFQNSFQTQKFVKLLKVSRKHPTSLIFQFWEETPMQARKSCLMYVFLEVQENIVTRKGSKIMT